MDRSTPDLPVHHQVLEFTQTHVRRVDDHLEWSQEPQGSSPFRTPIAESLQSGTGESGLVLSGGMELCLPLELFMG